MGLSLTTQDVQSVGAPSLAEKYIDKLYGGWLDVARTHADFLGVQTYTRFRVDEKGLVAPPKDAEMTDAGYEFYPQALANTIRWAHKAIGKPIYVTESGIATDDDTRRVAFIDQALGGRRRLPRRGIPVHSYLYWSLLDNFRVDLGLRQAFRARRRRPKDLQAHRETERAASGQNRESGRGLEGHRSLEIVAADQRGAAPSRRRRPPP